MNSFRIGAGSDERAYARAAARQAGCELLEVQYREDVRMERMLDALPFPFPPDLIGGLCSGEQEAEVVSTRGIQATFDGETGDELFGCTLSRFSTIDYIHLHGLRPALFEVALDSARAQHLTIWRVLGNAIRRSLQRTWSPLHEGTPAQILLAQEVTEFRSQTSSVNRWAAAAKKHQTPPGKLIHARAICDFTGMFTDPLSRESEQAQQISPLSSQPVVEAALRVPIHFLVRTNGMRLGRPMARRAFAGELPKEILYRRGKGAVADYTSALIRSNIAFLRHMLLGGVLMREGYLNRKVLEDALSDAPSGELEGLAQLFRLISVEVWLQSFEGKRSQVAA